MKLKEFLENLNNLVKEDPKSLDLEVIYSIDDEGNAFRSVYFEPTKGRFDSDEFLSGDQLEERDRDESEINAICIN